MSFNKKEQHNLFEIRPRFRLITTFSIPEVLNFLQESVRQDNSVIGKQVHDIFYLDVPPGEQHYWSPELRVSLEQNEAGEGTFIRCVLGPRHSVWLMFIFIYGFLSVLTLFGGMYGMAQWNVGNGTGWLWCFPIAFILIISVYIIAKLGQRTGRDQMLQLVSVLYHALGDHITERK